MADTLGRVRMIVSPGEAQALLEVLDKSKVDDLGFDGDNFEKRLEAAAAGLDAPRDSAGLERGYDDLADRENTTVVDNLERQRLAQEGSRNLPA